MKTEWTVNFDEEADVLYLNGEKQSAIAHEISDGVFVRVAESGEIVGVTIMDLREQLYKDDCMPDLPRVSKIVGRAKLCQRPTTKVVGFLGKSS